MVLVLDFPKEQLEHEFAQEAILHFLVVSPLLSLVSSNSQAIGWTVPIQVCYYVLALDTASHLSDP